jgi:hypothetical protein
MPRPQFAVGDRVQVVLGQSHGVGQTTGTIREVLRTVAYGVEFDGMPGKVHRWYVESELAPLAPPRRPRMVRDGTWVALLVPAALALFSAAAGSADIDAARRAERRTIEEVGLAWARGVPLKGGRGAFKTDGQTIWSYSEVIGETVMGRKVAYDFTYKGGRSFSVTTGRHVGIAKRYADVVRPPYTRDLPSISMYARFQGLR